MWFDVMSCNAMQYMCMCTVCVCACVYTYIYIHMCVSLCTYVDLCIRQMPGFCLERQRRRDTEHHHHHHQLNIKFNRDIPNMRVDLPNYM